MPEISQDNFESKNPMKCVITPGVLRARANSANSKNVKFTEDPALVIDKDRLPVQGLGSLRRTYTSENDLESFTVGMPSVENSWIDARELSHRYYS